MAPYPSIAERLRTCRGWIVTDGRTGTLATASGVAEALGLEFEHKRVAPRAIWSMLPSWSVLDPREELGKAPSLLSPPWPDIAIAAGARTIPYLQALRRASEGATFTVILHHPRTRSDVADLVWCPAHDHLSGANVVTTLTSPHRMRPHELAALRRRRPPEIAELGGPLAAVLLGGPNRDFEFSEGALERLGACLRNLAAAGTRFLITPSQRTTAAIFRTVTEATRGAERIMWTSKGTNPYWTFLAHADLTIVTGDSVNMTSEACVTGRPVYVFSPDGGSERYKRFHDGLRRYGATQALTLQTDPRDRWAYAPLDAAPRIAAEIARRFSIAREPRLCLPLGLSAARSCT
jgi:mitochondrial fission protein ELM1